MQRRRKISVSWRHLRLKTSENSWPKQRQTQRTATLCVLKNLKTLGFKPKRAVCAKNQTKLERLKLKRLLKALTLATLVAMKTLRHFQAFKTSIRFKLSRFTSIKNHTYNSCNRISSSRISTPF